MPWKLRTHPADHVAMMFAKKEAALTTGQPTAPATSEARRLLTELLAPLDRRPARVQLAERNLMAIREKRAAAAERLLAAINTRRANPGAAAPDSSQQSPVRIAQAEVDDFDRQIAAARGELERQRAEWAPKVVATNDLSLKDLQAVAARAAAELVETLAALADYKTALARRGLTQAITARLDDAPRAHSAAVDLARRLRVGP